MFLPQYKQIKIYLRYKIISVCEPLMAQRTCLSVGISQWFIVSNLVSTATLESPLHTADSFEEESLSTLRSRTGK